MARNLNTVDLVVNCFPNELTILSFCNMLHTMNHFITPTASRQTVVQSLTLSLELSHGVLLPGTFAQTE